MSAPRQIEVAAGDTLTFIAVGSPKGAVIVEPIACFYPGQEDLQAAIQDTAIFLTMNGRAESTAEQAAVAAFYGRFARNWADLKLKNALAVRVEFYTDSNNLLASRLAA